MRRATLIGVFLLCTALLGFTPTAFLVDRSIIAAQQAQAYGFPAIAAEIAASAAQRFPGRIDLWEKAGNYAWQASDGQAAYRFFQRALTARSLSPQGFLEMGDAAHANGDLPAALNAWQQALQFSSLHPEVYRRMLAIHQVLGDNASQITDLTALAELNPSDAHTHYQLGLLLAAHQPEAALPPLLRAAALDPTLAQAARAIQTAVNTAGLENDPAYLLISSGRALASLGEWQLAETAFTQATQLDPGFSEAWAFLGEAHLQLGRDGLPELEKAFQLDPDSVVANTLLGLYWRGKSATAQSLVYLDRAAELEPGNPTLQAELGSAYAAMGNLPAALEHYQQAVQIAPNDALYWRSLTNFCVDHQHQLHEVGLPAARQAVLLSPSDPASQDILAQVYILLDNPLLAQRFLERALQADPRYAPARLHRGVLYLLQGDLVQARQQLSLAFSLAGDDSATSIQAERLLEHASP